MNSLIDVHQNNGILVTTSRNIAEVFGKEHRNVVRDIRNVLATLPDGSKNWGMLNFEQTPYVDPQNGQTYTEYLITKDGLVLLIMGYTGETAMTFKLAYIQRFNEMEAQLKEQAKTPEVISLKTLNEHMDTATKVLIQTGLSGNQRALALNEIAKKTIGVDYLDLMGINLSENQEEVLLSPTEIGEIIGISNQMVNKILKDLGYQNKEENSKFWIPTEKGLKNGAHIVSVFRRASAGSINQLKWSPKVINVIKGLLK